jgi:hypothetical protein
MIKRCLHKSIQPLYIDRVTACMLTRQVFSQIVSARQISNPRAARERASAKSDRGHQNENLLTTSHDFLSLHSSISSRSTTTTTTIIISTWRHGLWALSLHMAACKADVTNLLLVHAYTMQVFHWPSLSTLPMAGDGARLSIALWPFGSLDAKSKRLFTAF